MKNVQERTMVLKYKTSTRLSPLSGIPAEYMTS